MTCNGYLEYRFVKTIGATKQILKIRRMTCVNHQGGKTKTKTFNILSPEIQMSLPESVRNMEFLVSSGRTTFPLDKLKQ